MSEPTEAQPLWTAQAIAEATRGHLSDGNFSVHGLAIDSREVVAGDLFIALGAARDGHDFVASALTQGAAGALVSRPLPGPCIRVDDTLRALERLALAARERAPGARRGAITGSVGKTSVTQAVLSGLTLAGSGHGSVRSFNNHIGVPLTLARMPQTTRRAIFEIGMNHGGELEPLSHLIRPHAVAITTVEAVHVENFPDGVRGVAQAKAESLAGLEPGGVAILNADNPWFAFLTERARDVGAEVRSFGVAAGAYGRLTGFHPTAAGARVEAVIAGRPIAYDLRQTAPHWGPMSLAALLMMLALDVDLEVALSGLAGFEPLAGRGAQKLIPLKKGVFTLIDESYNASPVSVTSALKALGKRQAEGRRIAVLTDMLELGTDSADRHQDLAAVVAAAGVDLVFCAGPLMKHLFDRLEPVRQGAWTPDAKALIPRLFEVIDPGDVVMVKGSKASKASAIADALALGPSLRGEG